VGSRPACASSHAATPATIDDSQLSFSLPPVSRKKVTAVFDGGRLSSDGGVMLLALVECLRNVAALIADDVKWPGYHQSHLRSKWNA
jgi:hypothetical protein